MSGEFPTTFSKSHSGGGQGDIMKNNITHIITIFACILIACLFALAASDGTLHLYGVPIIFLCAGASFVIHWAIAIPALITKTEKYFDLTGMIATLLIVVTAMIALFTSEQQVSIMSLIVAVFVSMWTLRLGTFLYIRIVKSGEDKRFREIKNSYPKFLMTWTLSALWVFLTTINAITLVVANPVKPLGLFFIIGASLWIFGFAFEAISDRQKKNFSSLPANKDQFISTGLWSISRHPNYFGEVVLWLGIAIISLPILSGWQFLTLISPVFVYLLITKISGLPFLEEKADKKWGADSEYLKYKNTTPLLFPYIGKN